MLARIYNETGVFWFEIELHDDYATLAHQPGGYLQSLTRQEATALRNLGPGAFLHHHGAKLAAHVDMVDCLIIEPM